MTLLTTFLHSTPCYPPCHTPGLFVAKSVLGLVGRQTPPDPRRGTPFSPGTPSGGPKGGPRKGTPLNPEKWPGSVKPRTVVFPLLGVFSWNFLKCARLEFRVIVSRPDSSQTGRGGRGREKNRLEKETCPQRDRGRNTVGQSAKANWPKLNWTK